MKTRHQELPMGPKRKGRALAAGLLGLVMASGAHPLRGEEVSDPVIASLEPTQGPAGTVVTVRGSHLGTLTGAVQGTSGVSFNRVWATARRWSESEIEVAVPPGAATGAVVVTVGGRASEGARFTVTGPGESGPAISTVSPGSGPAGAVVRIEGANFGEAPALGEVSFNGAWGTVRRWSDGAIEAEVPWGASTGPVVVRADGQASAGVGFRVVEAEAGAPVIGSLSPEAGVAGRVVRIEGERFGSWAGASQGTSGVSFNGVWGRPTFWSESEIQVAVPAGAPSGLVVVTVGGQASDGKAFRVRGPAPVIEEVDPGYGAEGDQVRIRGEHFGSWVGASQGTSGVSFNGAWSSPSLWSDSEIQTAVPRGALSGTVAVVVSGQASNERAFTVTEPAGLVAAVSAVSAASTAPSIKKVTPASGGVGTTVTVKGSRFGGTQGSSTVTFNGTAATASSWSDSKIKAAVPAGARSGPVVVTVGSQTSNGVSFTVSGASPSISGLNPTAGPVGTSVTISGTNFGAAQGTSTVTFNGTAATPTSWSATSIVAAAPTGATTGKVVVTVNGQASNGVEFTVAAPPSISGLNPTAGPVGTSVTISGTNFGASQETSTVTFNGTAATPTSWSATSIVAAVPAGATTGKVVVTVNGQASDGVDFTVAPPPAISGLNPTAGPAGTSVTISGTNFGGTQGSSTVTFNGTTATPTSWSATSIVAAVPAGATTGDVVVTVNGQASGGVRFIVGTPPVISKLKPASGAVGTNVKIKGTTFGASQGSSTVTFNGTPATPTSWSDTKIVAPVPAGASSGPVVVTVGEMASSGAAFTVEVPPAISGLAPTAGPVGTLVTISGTSFGGTQGSSTVTFNGTAATPTSWSDTSIVAPVPAGAATGNVVVTVNGRASSGVRFIVGTPPAISGLSPTSGPVGTSVTISGTSFGASQGNSTVTFNGTAATPTSWSATSIIAPVPAGATSGNVVVTVGEMASNGAAFTVVVPPAISGLNPTAGPVGTSVTISGTNFGGTQGTSTVTFNGTAATPTSWSATSIVAPAPAGATTGNVVVTVNGHASNGVRFIVGTPPAISKLKPISGTVGTNVKIKGTNFGASQGSSTVTFNGTAATPRSWSGSKIIARVPAGATTGNIVVTVGEMASNGAAFTVETPPPAISALSPAAGPVGTSVAISGTSFGGTQGSSTVTFNGTAAAPTSWSETSIAVPVPAGATTGNVVVTVNGRASNGVRYTVGTPPAISALSPTAGPVGTAVTITGTNFRATQGSSTVTFNGTATTPTSWSATSIVAPAPAGATSGNVVVTVGGMASSGVRYIVGTPPVISGLSPTSGPVGTAVTISGTNFGASQGSSTVTFNGTTATPTSWSATSIVAPAPTEATSGNVVVTVGEMASNGVAFTVKTPPAISGLSPTAGPVGTSVTISGTKFGATQGSSTVTFNGTAATASSWSDTSIVAAAPAGATSGNVVVTAGGQASNGVRFIVGTPPAISTVQPAWGPVGTVVTISGTNFGASQGSNTVTFNGTAATPTSWSATSIVAPAPAGATSGNVVVTVGEMASNGVRYIVGTPPAITTLSPTSGPVGTSVTISGTNFGGTQGTSTVSFNGTAATASSWSATSIVAPVPAGAATGKVVVTVGGMASNGAAFTVALPAITLTSNAASLSEPSGTATITARVPAGSAPAEATTITLTHSGTATHSSDYTVGVLTIAANQTSGTATLTVSDDSTYEGQETIGLKGSAAGYAESALLSIPLNDDETPPITLTSSAASVSEPSGTATITARVPAGSAPAEATTITLTHSGTATHSTDYTVGVLTIAANQTSGTATLTVSDDSIDEGQETIGLKGSATGYAESALLSIPLEDNDTAGVTVSPTSLTVAEGSSGTYTVKLNTKPTAGVTISLTESHDDVTLNPASLAFTTGNWNTARTVTVTVGQDDDADDETAAVSHASSSDDSNYNGVSVSGVSVTLDDDDTAGVTVSPTSLTVGEGSSGTYRVKLNTKPTASVTISVSDNSAEISEVPTALTFTTSNWNSNQTVTVSARHDSDTSNESARISHGASSTDSKYNGNNISISSVSVTVTDDDEPDPPTISCSASPTNIRSGGSSTLSWSTTNANSVSITGIGTVGASGTRSVSPTETKTYKFTASGNGGTSSTCRATVTVWPEPRADFRADPPNICEDGCSTLRWSTTNATSVSIKGIGTVPLNGSRKVCPDETTIYTITVSNPGGSATFNATVTVWNRPTATISANPPDIRVGGESTLTWSTTNATSVSIDQGIGKVPLNGSRSVSPTVPTTYTLTASNPSCPAATATTTVTVWNRPEATISASPTDIKSGEKSTLTWSTTNAKSVSITPNPGIAGTIPPNGSHEVTLTATTTYTISASNPVYTAATDSATVTVWNQPTATISANPTRINSGGSSTLTWSTTNAKSISINQGIGTVGASGTRSVSPTTTKTYTISASNPVYTAATGSATVTVGTPAPRITSITPGRQRPDDPVTISGSNFGTTADTVYFGGHTVISFSSWSNSSISLLIPRSAQPGTVSVSVRANGQTSNSVSYTITGQPLGLSPECKDKKDCPEASEETAPPAGSGEGEEEGGG